MSNILPFKRSRFDCREACVAARSFKDVPQDERPRTRPGKRKSEIKVEYTEASTIQHVMKELALSTDQDGRVLMTIPILCSRIQMGRNAVGRAIAVLEDARVLLRIVPGAPAFEWNNDAVHQRFLLVQAADKAAGVSDEGIILPSSNRGQVLQIIPMYREAERTLRRAGKLPRISATTNAPSEKMQQYLESWTSDFSADNGVDLELVPVAAWLAFRTFPRNDRGDISYRERSWPFSLLPGEIQFKADRFEERVFKAMNTKPRTIDVPLMPSSGLRPAHDVFMALAGGAS